MDSLDVRILKKLAMNCRTSFEGLAREQGVTSTTIKKRVDKLFKSGTIENYVVELNRSATKGQRVLLLITVDGKENSNSFANSVGSSPLVESVSCLSDGRYLAHAVCCGLEDFARLDRFLRNLSNVHSVEIHPLRSRQIASVSLTRMQLEILDCLRFEPRLQSSEVASRLNRSVKGVRMAIRRLIDSGLVKFTVQCSFFTYFVEVRDVTSRMSLEEMSEWISKEFPCVWEVVISSVEPILYVTFVTEQLNEISHIRKRLQEVEFPISINGMFGEPRRFFKSHRSNALARLVAGNS